MDRKDVRKRARKQAEELVDQMTLMEKASQLRYDAPAIPRLHIPAYNWWNESLHGVARGGTATVFPQAIGLAASFDREMLEEIGEAIALEGRAKYNAAVKLDDRDIYKGLTFWAPNVNIFRDPRWGRGHETYGEDPYLSSRLGVSYIRGLQGDGETMKAAACAKHFAVHSGPEALRHEFDAEVSEKDLRETYLPAFQACVQEARQQAELLREEAFEEGKKAGEQEGIRSAYEEHRKMLNKELRSFQQNFADVIRDVSIQKDKILEKNIDDLKQISISIAEKVIHTSIRSSEEIIKRMILAATEKLKKRQWAKIYITKCNTDVNMEVDAEFLESLSHLSDNLKIITMNDGEEGTCIVELPDEVIDASVGTQLENIKDILNNVRR